MPACIFCAIVAGDAPAEVIFEDSDCIAILDINPATRGHSLVIPREHHTDLLTIPEDVAAAAMRTAHTVARKLELSLRPAGFNLVQATRPAAWQTVFHFHLHVVPRYEKDGLVPPWPIEHDGSPAELRQVADEIRAAE